VVINLKRPNIDYPIFLLIQLIDLNLAFVVTNKRNIPRVELVLTTVRFGRLYRVTLQEYYE